MILKRHGERRASRLEESEFIRNLGIAHRLVADIACLSDAIGESAFLEINNQSLGYILSFLIPVSSKKGEASTAVKSATIVVHSGSRIVEGGLTSGYFIIN